MGDTSIEWTRGDDGSKGSTWNPTRGCSRVSPGCENCFAEGISARFSMGARAAEADRPARKAMPYHGFAVMSDQGPRWTRKVALVPEHLGDPLRWRQPRRIFVNSMSDVFHEKLTNEDIAAIFGVMAAAPRHTFQVLTKRAKRMREWFEWIAEQGRLLPTFAGAPIPLGSSGEAASCVGMAGHKVIPAPLFIETCERTPWPLKNVWLGVSVEDQHRADERIPDLLATPATVRFLSVEPLLEGLDFGIDLEATSRRFGAFTCPKCNGWGGMLSSLYPDVNGNEQIVDCKHCRSSGCAIDWVIVGGESGPSARRFDIEWARSIVRQCREANVACFVKQFGLLPYDSTSSSSETLQLVDAKGGDPTEWPDGDWPREFPEVAA